MTTQTPTLAAAPPLTPVESTPDRLLVCDYCDRTETSTKPGAGFFAPLLPMFRDADGCLVCARCAEESER